MKKFDHAPPAKLICGMLFKDARWSSEAVRDLSAEYGEIDYESLEIPFTYTDYYTLEMGEPLTRKFISFKKLIDPGELANIKVFSNNLEENYRQQAGTAGRVLNVDPGYLTATSYILATSKNYAHRIYLGKGVYAQQELLYERKKFRTLDWTYPDYRTQEYGRMFLMLRDVYMDQMRNTVKSEPNH